MEIISIDASELDSLAVDLSGSPGRIQRSAPKVMKRSALEVKRRMQEEFSGHRYAGAVPGSLEFEEYGSDLSYRVGELDSGGPQWGLAAILSYGTSNNAPVADHRKSLWQEAPSIVDHLGDAGEDAVLSGAE